jgi:hypothetical protein
MPLISPEVVEENFRAPGTCIICTRSQNKGVGGSMVDTGQDNETPFASPRTGRIYVCDQCVKELAECYGYEKGEDAKAAKAQVAVANEQLATLRADIAGHVEQLKQVGDSIPTLTA